MAQDFPTTGSPPMIGRRLAIAEWRDYIATYDFGSLPPSRIVLHHTYRPNECQWRGLASMRGMQNYYAGLGWSAAPHIYTGPDGIWLFTPMSRIGIHAGTGNGSLRAGWYSIGLEMVGYFDKVRPTGAVWEYSKAVMGELARRLGIAPRDLISFHRDYTNQKSCPGWAVTKDWVWAEVEAYLNNASAPTLPPGPIGDPEPETETLLERLLHASYERRAQGYNSGWAFHNHAVEHGLGMPLGHSSRLTVAGSTYNYQVFARDTLFCEVPNWGDVRSMHELLAGSIPPGGLGRALLDASFQTGGATFRPDWAFHQFALTTRLGPAMGDSGTLTVDGVCYAYQAFAVDTLYNAVPHWSDVQQLSRLNNTNDQHLQHVREALLSATYRAGGADYHADWAFHQLAHSYNIGMPLADPFQVRIGKTDYNIQVYTLDTLYNVVPHWSEVTRLKDLAEQHGMVFGADFDAPFASDGGWAPSFHSEPAVLHYTPRATAFSSRDGAAVELLLLHGLPGAASTSLERMTTVGAQRAVHYYVSATGEVYDLVDPSLAAWHAGFASLDGLWYNLNRVSIGIGIERPAGWPDITQPLNADQQCALYRLLVALAYRYKLPPGAIVLWGDLAAGDQPGNSELPLAELRAAVAAVRL